MRVVLQVNELDGIVASHLCIPDLAVPDIIRDDGFGGLIDARSISIKSTLHSCVWPESAVGDLSIERPQQERQGKTEGRLDY
jgi:hypothetical protein